jgi:hypothetical protein
MTPTHVAANRRLGNDSHRIEVDAIASLDLSRKIKNRQADGLDFDWWIVELLQKQTAKMIATFVETHALPLNAKHSKERIIRLHGRYF